MMKPAFACHGAWKAPSKRRGVGCRLPGPILPIGFRKRGVSSKFVIPQGPKNVISRGHKGRGGYSRRSDRRHGNESGCGGTRSAGEAGGERLPNRGRRGGLSPG